MTTPKRAPQNWVSANVDPTEKERMDAVLAEIADIKVDGRGSLAKKRQTQAHRYALDLLRGVASSPALRTGAELEPEAVRALVDDMVATENVPASLRADVKKTALEIVKRVGEGNRKEADDMAREAAIGLGESLAKSSWSGPPEREDPAALAAAVPR